MRSIWGIVVLGGLLISQASAQSSNDQVIGPRCLYGKFGPDCPQQQQGPVQPEPVMAFCWTTTPVPNTKVVVITGQFQTFKSQGEISDQLEDTFARRGYATAVECSLGSYTSQIQNYDRVVAQLRQQGYQPRFTTDTVR